MAEEPPNMLWSYRIITRTSTSETPFFLTFDVEVVIPLEIKFQSFRIVAYDDEEN